MSDCLKNDRVIKLPRLERGGRCKKRVSRGIRIKFEICRYATIIYEIIPAAVTRHKVNHWNQFV